MTRRKISALVAGVSLLAATLFGIGPAQAAPANPQASGGTVTDPTGVTRRIGAQSAAQPGAKGSPERPRKLGTRSKPARHDSARLLTATYRYAGAHQAFNADGAKANVEVPTVGTLDSGDHSLVELSVERETGSGAIDAVEIGFQKGEVGCASQCLFVYSWENSIGQGYNGGNSWTDIVDTCGAGGTNVVAGQAETAGASISLGWLYGGSPLGWYAYRSNCGIGYYPAAAWTGTTFTSATTTFNQAFGEVFDSDGSATPCTNMGNGTLAAVGPPAAGANVGSYLLGSASSASVNLTGFTLNNISASYFDVAMLSARTFRYGGPASC